MSGTLYGVGVGPGDPKLLTLLAAETICKCPVIAVPAKGKEHAVSYKIARGAIEDIEKKECLNLSTPMTKDRNVLSESYRRAAERIMEKLKEGKDVAYLTLGDPTIYSTYIYIHRIVEESGHKAEIINGIPSFCAVAASLGVSLADRSEQMHVIPSNYDIEGALELKGSKVLMKAASKMAEVKQLLLENGIEATMVENCGMQDEKVHRHVEDMPEEASYYSIVLVREKETEKGLPWTSI